MDDHFWPTLYPAITVGLLMGLAGGSVVSTALGAVGGLIGAAALYFVFAWLGLQESILSLVGLVGGAVAGAYLLMSVGERIAGARSSAAK
jgi:hypothetical protein